MWEWQRKILGIKRLSMLMAKLTFWILEHKAAILEKLLSNGTSCFLPEKEKIGMVLYYVNSESSLWISGLDKLTRQKFSMENSDSVARILCNRLSWVNNNTSPTKPQICSWILMLKREDCSAPVQIWYQYSMFGHIWPLQT